MEARLQKSNLLSVVGPTGSGKTAVSLVLAERLNGEIVSADSRQIYRHLDIGTAKPTKEERKRIPHHFIDILDLSEDYSAGKFGGVARETILDILGRGKQPILVGGSGLYIKAVTQGLFDGPEKNTEIRNQLETLLKEEGPDTLLATLERIDPESAVRMERSKPRRIIRALEVYYVTGVPISKFHREQSTPPPFEVHQFGLDWPRDILYRRINDRVDAMLSGGLVGEVKQLLARGYGKGLNALNTVGYKEVLDYLGGNLDYDEAVNLMKRNTRRFAKRQMTWFRADKSITWIKLSDSQSVENVAGIILDRFSSG
ncbi:MAG TPA: tRNA (adenosine(37)-N6)-dimethylallyltransferase MiaA [Bacteroidota bacterium]